MAEFQIRHRYHSQGLAAGGSALLDAINRGKVHLAKFILDAGEFDVVNTRDFNGKTPLIRACYIKEEKTRDRVVSLLLRRGADVNLRDDRGMTVCSYACQLRCNDVVRILVRNNVDPDIADNCGNTALIWSALVGNDVAVEILVRSFRRLGLNVNHVNDDGLTALLVAAKNGFVACASLLAIEGRANVSARDPVSGMTAEQLARDRGCSAADVMSFSVTRNTDSPGRRGVCWAGRSLRMSRLSSGGGGGGGGGGGAKSGAEGFDDDDSSADVIGRSSQMTGSEDGNRMEDESEGIRRQTTTNRHQTRLQFRQRSSSVPSMRFGSVEFSRDMSSSATVNPCSTSLGGASFNAMLNKEKRRSNRPAEDAVVSGRRSNRTQTTEDDAPSPIGGATSQILGGPTWQVAS